MGDLETALKGACMTLLVIWALNQVPATRELVQIALNGR